MNLLRLVYSHPIVCSQMETAARMNQWAKFRADMLAIDVSCEVLHDPFAIWMIMKHDAGLVWPDMAIILPIGSSGIPWTSTLSTLSDYKRVGMHSITWGFSRASHRKMAKAGIHVDTDRT